MPSAAASTSKARGRSSRNAISPNASPGVQHVDDPVVVAHLERAVEHHEDVAGGAAALEDTIALLALDDVAPGDATVRLVVGEPLERGDPLRVELVERVADVAPVVVELGQRLAAYRTTPGEHGLDAPGQLAGRRRRPEAAQPLDVGEERHERDEVPGAGAVDVVRGVRPLPHLEVHREQVRLAAPEHQPQVEGVHELGAVHEHLFEHAGAPVLGQHAVALADGQALGRDLGEERGEVVLLDLAGREAVAAPGHAVGGHHPVAVTRVEQPTVLVFGLGEPVRLGALDVVVPVHLVDVHRIAQRLHRLDLGAASSPDRTRCSWDLRAVDGEVELGAPRDLPVGAHPLTSWRESLATSGEVEIDRQIRGRVTRVPPTTPDE